MSADSEAGEITYTANFKTTEVTPEEPEAEKKELKLTYTAGEGGTVSDADETIDLNAADKTVKGSTATANEGYEFVNWTTSDGTEISTSAEFVPEISDVTEAGEKSYKANFKLTEVVKEKNLEISYKASKGGSVSSDKETVDLNADKISVKGSTATADEGYEFVNWTDADGKEVSTDAKLVPSANADMESGSVSYTANFKETKKENEITISYRAADGGSVSSNEEKVDLAADKITVKGSTAKANDGYKFKNWTDADGKEVSTDEKYVPEVTAPAEGEKAKDLAYTANFEKTVKITYTFDPENSGTVSGDDEVVAGDSLTFTVMPGAEYTIDTVKTNDEELTSTSDETSAKKKYTIEKVTEDTEIVITTKTETEHPEFNATMIVNGMTIKMHAKEGVLPAGVTAFAKEVTSVAEDVVASNEDIATAYAYDITLNDKSGNKLDNDLWASNGAVHVTFEGSKISEMSEDADTVSVMHVDESGNVQEPVATEDVSGKTISEIGFDAEHFSTYLVKASNSAYKIIKWYINGEVSQKNIYKSRECAKLQWHSV